MKTHTLFGVGLTALILGGFAASSATIAGDRDATAAVKQANDNAGKASKALAKGDAQRAVSLAEAAVAMAPTNADYRLLLGQSYLKAGRFTSAGQTFSDVLALAPGNGKAALNLALTQIATGQWDVARQTLNDHAEGISARDRGLAIALAGDPEGGLAVLMEAARSPAVDMKTRQNLALVLALSGRWREAKTMVEVDVAPEEANKRIMQWIAFAKPVSASDQVAALLGVVPVKDDGRPVALALNAPVPVATAEAAPIDSFMPGNGSAPVQTAEVVEAPAPVEHAPVEVAAAASPVVETPIANSELAKVIFAERREVVQMLPARAERPAPAMIAAQGAFKKKLAAAVMAPVLAKAPTKGNWYVQLGAYDSAGVARDAWARATRRFASLGDHTPAGMTFKAPQGEFYRLSVGGFARPDALAMCRTFRARGGQCFVRTGAGDQTAQWAKPTKVQLASR